MFITNLTALNKSFFNGDYWEHSVVIYLICRICVFLKLKLLCNEEEFYYTETELLDLNITLPLANLDMVASKLVSNGLLFLNRIPADIQLVFFCCHPVLLN